MPIRSGDIIDGRYRLERTLGIGGMGIVFEAHHIELEVRRAIKIMQSPTGKNTGADNADPSAQVRFLREARAAARIVSEHVAQVYDVGVLESGERYMVIEYLSGTDLERLVRKRGPVPADMAVTYSLQACSGIAAAHKLGIIHRDIKSSNLFLTESGVLKVIDWGLAKQTLNGETGITQTNHVVGSLEYMSPEQLNGGEVDARTDIWSLGVVLHELVTGKLPFTGGTCGEVIHNILHKEPTATTWMSEVSLTLDAIVRRCLQKDRNQRYASVDALARDLRSVCITRPSTQATVEMTTDGTLATTSPSDAPASERLPDQREQETAVQRHRRQPITGSPRSSTGESKPIAEARPTEKPRRTSGSRTALHALLTMGIVLVLIYAMLVQPYLSRGATVAMSRPSPASVLAQPVRPAPAPVNKPATGYGDAGRIGPESPDAAPGVPQPRPPESPSKPPWSSPTVPRRDPPPRDAPRVVPDRRPAPDANPRGAVPPGPEQPPTGHTPGGPDRNEPDTGKQPRRRPDVSPGQDLGYKR